MFPFIDKMGSRCEKENPKRDAKLSHWWATFLLFSILTRTEMACAAPILVGTVDHGLYTSEYVQIQNPTALSWADAAQTCINNGYTLAVLPTNTSLSALTSLAGSSAWLAGSDQAVDGEWRWTAGRLSGLKFNQGRTCLTVPYNPVGTVTADYQHCYWVAGEPNGGTSVNCLQLYIRTRLTNDLNCATAIDSQICERSPCKLGTDCSTWGTSAMEPSRYFPNCVCNCEAGFSGSKCDIVIHDHAHGMYRSEYTVRCPSFTNFNTSRASCRSLGPGWEIASFPINAAFARMLSPFLVTWVGADDMATEGRWVWTAGRMAGLNFLNGQYPNAKCNKYVYQPHTFYRTEIGNDQCRFTPSSEPNDSSGAEDCANVNKPSASTWNDGNCSSTTIRCAACERSPCRMGTDCVNKTTDTMAGAYYPDCTCRCKPGFTGKYCHIAVINHTLFMSEYQLVCEGPSSFDEAAAACRNRGAGWDIATFPTSESISAFQQLMSPFAKTYVAGRYYDGNVSQWQWSAGRLQGLPFSNVTTWMASVYRPFGQVATRTFNNTAWAAGEPSGSGAQKCTALSSNTVIASLDDVDCSPSPASSGLMCAACERSPCQMGADCHPSATLSMSGDYFPNCTCTCKPGYFGKYCEKTRVDQGPYVSEYDLVCSAQTFQGALEACRAYGNGYGLATFPTRLSQELFAVQLRPKLAPTWLGATDAPVEGTWRWVAGRLNQLIFLSASRNSTEEYRPFNALPFQFPDFFWSGAEPNGGTTESCADIRTAAYPFFNDFVCAAQNPCFACERSPCKLGTDCAAGGTQAMVGDHFPNCTCTCKANYEGPACSIVRVRHQIYTSEYHHICNTSSFSFSTAVAECRKRGPMWDLASFPTMAAFAALSGLLDPFQRTWVGASDALTEGKWLWAGGRLQDISLGSTCSSSQIYATAATAFMALSYCPWTAPEPSGGAAENCAEVGPIASLKFIDSPCETSGVRCFACERSPCQLGTDCVLNTTSLMTHDYFPNCQCQCKSGYSGRHCEILSVDFGQYMSQYQLKCSPTAMNRSFAASNCRAEGNGWGLATFPTVASLNAFVQLFPNSTVTPSGVITRTWIAASNRNLTGSWVWDAGRLAGLQFSQGATCKSYTYRGVGSYRQVFSSAECSWMAGEPGGAPEDCANIYEGVGKLNAEGCSKLLYCQACERSPCRLGADCNAGGTATMQGDYYPACSCTCKPGFAGSKCEITVVDHTIYESQYELTCGSNVNFTQAAARCEQRGAGWALASFPTNKSLEQFAPDNISTEELTWIGASDLAKEGTWQWLAGRLAGKAFFTNNSVCNAYEYRPIYNAAVFFDSTNCTFNSGESNGNGGWSNENCVQLKALKFMNDVRCNRSDPCVVCERSPCRMGTDCHATATLSMRGDYFPNCTCTCKPGHNGTRCEHDFQTTPTTLLMTIGVSYTNSASGTMSKTNSIALPQCPPSPMCALADVVVLVQSNQTVVSGGGGNSSDGRINLCAIARDDDAFLISTEAVALNNNNSATTSQGGSSHFNASGAWIGLRSIGSGGNGQGAECLPKESSLLLLDPLPLPPSAASPTQTSPPFVSSAAWSELNSNSTHNQEYSEEEKGGGGGGVAKNETSPPPPPPPPPLPLLPELPPLRTGCFGLRVNHLISWPYEYAIESIAVDYERMLGARDGTLNQSHRPHPHIGSIRLSHHCNVSEPPPASTSPPTFTLHLENIAPIVIFSSTNASRSGDGGEENGSGGEIALEDYYNTTSSHNNKSNKNDIVVIRETWLPSGWKSKWNFTPVYFIPINISLICKEKGEVGGDGGSGGDIAAVSSSASSVDRRRASLVIAIEAPYEIMEIRNPPPPLTSSPPSQTSHNETIVPIPRPPFIPSTATERLGTAVAIIVVSVGGVALPVAGMQQGVAMALLRMMQCEADGLSDDNNGAEDQPLSFLVHPLGFSIGGGSVRDKNYNANGTAKNGSESDGGGGGQRKYARGAIVGNIVIIPLIWFVLARAIAPFFVMKLGIREGERGGGDNKKGAQTSAGEAKSLLSFAEATDFVGWPGNMVVPFTLLAEGTTMCAIALLSPPPTSSPSSAAATHDNDHYDSGVRALDIFLGIFGLLALLAVTLVWFGVIYRQLFSLTPVDSDRFIPRNQPSFCFLGKETENKSCQRHHAKCNPSSLFLICQQVQPPTPMPRWLLGPRREWVLLLKKSNGERGDEGMAKGITNAGVDASENSNTMPSRNSASGLQDNADDLSLPLIDGNNNMHVDVDGALGGEEMLDLPSQPSPSSLSSLVVVSSDSGEGGDDEEGERSRLRSPNGSRLDGGNSENNDTNTDEDHAEDANESFLRRRSFLVGDSWWLWSSLLAHCFSILVGVADGMPSGTNTLCRFRWFLAAAGAVGQSLVVLTNTVPLELGLLGLTSLLSCLFVVFVAVSTFGAFESAANGVNEAVNAVGSASAFVGLALMAVGIFGTVMEVFKPRKLMGRDENDKSDGHPNLRGGKEEEEEQQLRENLDMAKQKDGDDRMNESRRSANHHVGHHAIDNNPPTARLLLIPLLDSAAEQPRTAPSPPLSLPPFSDPAPRPRPSIAAEPAVHSGRRNNAHPSSSSSSLSPNRLSTNPMWSEILEEIDAMVTRAEEEARRQR